MKKSFSISILAITMFLGAAVSLSAAELSQGTKPLERESSQGDSDKRGMRSAFLGTNDDSGSQDSSSEEGVGVEGGEYGAPAGGSSPGTSVSLSTITRIANNNTTISTPYTYKGK